MLENLMHNLGDTALFGIVSIVMFFAFFLGMSLWAIRLKKNYLRSMGALPLDNESVPPSAANRTTS